MQLPPVLRSLHQATGVGIWIATFTLAYLARIGSGSAATRAVARAQPRIAHASRRRIAHGVASARARARAHDRRRRSTPSAQSFARDLVALTKPRIISLLLVTTIAPMYVAGDPSWQLVLPCSSAAT